MKYVTGIERFRLGDYPMVCVRSGLPATKMVPVQARRTTVWPWALFPVSLLWFVVARWSADSDHPWGKLPFAEGHVNGVKATFDKQIGVIIDGVHPDFVDATRVAQGKSPLAHGPYSTPSTGTRSASDPLDGWVRAGGVHDEREQRDEADLGSTVRRRMVRAIVLVAALVTVAVGLVATWSPFTAMVGLPLVAFGFHAFWGVARNPVPPVGAFRSALVCGLVLLFLGVLTVRASAGTGQVSIGWMAVGLIGTGVTLLAGIGVLRAPTISERRG